jgi:CheY-like chemotaxis protein
MRIHRALRIVALNDNPLLLRLVCGWFERSGHTCVPAALADFPGPLHEALPRFLAKHAPEVIVFDVGKPFGASWDLLVILHQLRETRPYPIVATTQHRAKLETEVGWATGVLQVCAEEDFPPLLAAVEHAGQSQAAQVHRDSHAPAVQLPEDAGRGRASAHQRDQDQ